MKKEFNLRERAEIVSLAQEASKGLIAQPLIDFFAEKDDDRNIWKEATDFAKTLVPKDIEERFNKYCDEHEFNRNDRQFFKRLVAEAVEFDLTIAMLKHDCDKPSKKFHVAKSGRKYRSIPDGMDVETWDTMNPIERLNHMGLIIEKPLVGTLLTVKDCEHYDEAQGRNRCCHPDRVGKCEGVCKDFKQLLSKPVIKK
jgi:hypothetical protein